MTFDGVRGNLKKKSLGHWPFWPSFIKMCPSSPGLHRIMCLTERRKNYLCKKKNSRETEDGRARGNKKRKTKQNKTKQSKTKGVHVFFLCYPVLNGSFVLSFHPGIHILHSGASNNWLCDDSIWRSRRTFSTSIRYHRQIHGQNPNIYSRFSQSGNSDVSDDILGSI